MKITKPKKINGKIGAMLCVESPPERLRQDILNAFTFENPAYKQAERFSPWGPPANIPQYVTLAQEKGSSLFFPRGIIPHAQLSEKSLKLFSRIDWKDVTSNAPTEFPKLKVKLNNEQTFLYEAFIKANKIKSHPFRSYLFIAPTSTGKTIAQAVLGAHTKQRTLVLCLTNLIKRAWYEDLSKAFGLGRKDIGLIQQKTWRIGEQFTLASIATLARRKDRWPELFKQIGTLIVDEADTISAPSIYNFIMSCPAKYQIGATATHIGRSRDFYLQSVFGTPVKRLLVTQTDTESSMAVQDVKEITTAFQYEYDFANLDYNDLLDHLSTDEKRNNILVNEILRDWKAKHCPLIVTKRVAHVHLLVDMLKEAGVKNVRMITGETNTAKKETEKVIQGIFDRKYRCIVATTNAVMRGGNLNPLDVLHVLCPVNKNELEQLIGRIRRRYEGKTKCLVRIYLDKGVPYLYNNFKRNAIPVFRKLKVKRYENLYVC